MYTINALISSLFALNMFIGGYALYVFNIQSGSIRIIWTAGLVLLFIIGANLFFLARKKEGSVALGLTSWTPIIFLARPLKFNIWLPELSITIVSFAISFAIILVRPQGRFGSIFLFGAGVVGNVLLLSAPKYEWSTLVNSSWKDYFYCWFGLYCLLLSVLIVFLKLLKCFSSVVRQRG